MNFKFLSSRSFDLIHELRDTIEENSSSCLKRKHQRLSKILEKKQTLTEQYLLNISYLISFKLRVKYFLYPHNCKKY